MVRKKSREKENDKKNTLGSIDNQVIDPFHNRSAFMAAQLITDSEELKMTSLNQASAEEEIEPTTEGKQGPPPIFFCRKSCRNL